MFSSELESFDGVGIYSKDFIQNEITDPGDKTTILDYVRMALDFSVQNIDSFYFSYATELLDILDYLEDDAEQGLEQIFNLCKRHGSQVQNAILKMRTKYDDPFISVQRGSFLDIVSKRDYLRPAVELLVEKICNKMSNSIPIIFRQNQPINENDLNDKINGILQSDLIDYEREFPTISFALAKTIPDHAVSSANLLIETKYLRGNTGKSVITDGLSSDLIKYPSSSNLLFIIYDPERKIHDDTTFCNDFYSKRSNMKIHFVR